MVATVPWAVFLSRRLSLLPSRRLSTVFSFPTAALADRLSRAVGAITLVADSAAVAETDITELAVAAVIREVAVAVTLLGPEVGAADPISIRRSPPHCSKAGLTVATVTSRLS
jgi:hypothetical protein